jgi:hypothetical protein
MARKLINKVQLSNEPAGYSSIFGIVSAEPAYKLSVLINQTLGSSLQITESLSVSYGERTTGFPRFSDKSDLPHSSLSLIQNRSEEQSLMRKFPNIDYIVIRSGEADLTSEEQRYATRLRSIKHVTAVFIIDRDKVDPSVLEAIMPGE